MDLLKPVKLYIGQRLLKKELHSSSRTQKFYSLDMAETVGIVYEYKDEEEFLLVEKLVGQLHDEKKIVTVMVYIKDIKMLNYIPQRLTVDYIRPKDMDLFYRPRSGYVDDFINKHFHILIDLNYGQSFPLKYIVALSKAYYKVGVFHENNQQQLDLLIKMDAEKGMLYIIREILRYLKIINPHKGSI